MNTWFVKVLVNKMAGISTAKHCGRKIQVQWLGHARECRSPEVPKRANATMSKLGDPGYNSMGIGVNMWQHCPW